jgi:LuxR family maltose regulon positive regulatory protein
MARATPLVTNGVLHYRDGVGVRAVEVGGDAWCRWLDDVRTTTFRVDQAPGSFTARKEQRQRGGAYWYAYRTQGGRLRKCYLGRTKELTLRRLEEVAMRLDPVWEATERVARSEDALPRYQMSAAAAAELPLDALLATKLYLPPPRPDLVRRPRLTERLAAGLRGPCTMIIAPAGFGKTTLLGEWYASREDPWPVAWLSLDEADNDLARWLRYLVGSLRTLHTGIGLTVLGSLRSPRLPPVETVLTLLLNDLMARPHDAILVLDDYHLIDTPAIHQAMAFLLDHLPPRLHVVIAARSEPPLPLARLRARGRLTELRAVDLRFTTNETAAFLDHTMGVQLATEYVARLDSCAEGWVTGLQLAALALRGREAAELAAAIAAFTGTHRFVFDYLADEVFDRQPEDIRRFLLQTAVLDRLHGALCDAVTNGAIDGHTNGHGRSMLERLDAANLFLVPLDESRTWFRYHHYFAGFLRERLRREQPDLALELRQRASHWYEQQGLPVEAADYALAAQDHPLAARLIEQATPALLWQRGELATLLRWMERLPRKVVAGRPRLCVELAWLSLWSAHVDAIEPLLQDAERVLAAEARSHDPEVLGAALHGEIAAIRAELARQQGDIATAIALARKALDDLPISERRVRGVTSGLLGGAYFWRGDMTSASRAFADAAAASQTASTMTLALIACGRLVLVQALNGKLHQAATTYRQTLELAASHAMAATAATGVADVGMGEVLRQWSDLGAAADLLRRGIAHCAAVGGLAEMALDGTLILARVLEAQGDVAGACAALEQGEVLGRNGNVAQYAARIAVEQARLWLNPTRGDPDAVRRWAAGLGYDTTAINADHQEGYLALLKRLALAHWQIAQGRYGGTATVLQRLLGEAEAGGLVGCAIEILSLLARLHYEQGQLPEAMIALTQALSLGEPEGYVRVFLDAGMPMVALLREAQKRGVAPAYVARLLAACKAPATETAPAPVVIEALSERERELLALLAAGLSTPEIATRLFITTGTVRNHLKSIYGKLDVHSKLQAVERARAVGLL